MRTRAFSSSSSEDEEHNNGGKRRGVTQASAPPQGGRRFLQFAENSQTARDSLERELRVLDDSPFVSPAATPDKLQRQVCSAPRLQYAASPTPLSAGGPDEAERSLLQAQCDRLSQALEQALSQSELLKRERSELVAELEQGSHSSRQEAGGLEPTYGLHARRPHSTASAVRPVVVDNTQAASNGTRGNEEEENKQLADGWYKALDAESGNHYYCPVTLTACGEAVWALPQEGVIFCSSFAEQMRAEEQHAADAAHDVQAWEAIYALIRKLFWGFMLLQVCMCVASGWYLESRFGIFSKMVMGELPHI